MDSNHINLFKSNLALMEEVVIKNYHDRGYDYGNNFSEWCDSVEANLFGTRNADLGRKHVYYVLQPLHDAISNKNYEVGNRTKLVKAFDEVMLLGIQYLKGYYTGKPDLDIVSKILEHIKPLASVLKKYYCKERNCDWNGIYNTGIFMYLKQFMNHCLDNNHVPNTVLACACGGFEMSMALSGVCNIPLEVIRYSKRRGDGKMMVFNEHRARINKSIKDKFVIIVDDYVCYGQTMNHTMKKIIRMKPSKMLGSSVCGGDNGGSGNVKITVKKEKFNLYEWSN